MLRSIWSGANSLFLFFAFMRLIWSINTLGAEVICNRIRGLTEKQREMCRTAPDAIVAVGAGVRLGLHECQSLFAYHRWNCTEIGWPNVFTHVVVVGSKEAAFTYAIASAGVTYAITAACRRGNITSCGCYPSYPHRRDTSPSGWKWGGCSVDIDYGVKFARRFLDAREIERDARSAMNLHNNKAGRKVVKSNLLAECKCHGVSGSCTMRTCWETLPSFRKIGNALFSKYRRARPVVAVSGISPRATNQMSSRLKLVVRRPRSSEAHENAPNNISPKKSELVFLQPSPNYCDWNPQKGSLGTLGRICNRTSSGSDGCDILCCGRGYNTQQVINEFQCRCKFIWCCSVQCDTCIKRIEQHTCK